jgi:tetratricopeptide (TPR) repeat protein
MIDITTREQTMPDHIPEILRFRMPSLSDPLLDSTSMNFVADIEGIGEAHIERSVDSIELGDVQAILDAMVARSRRDVTRYPRSARTHANLGVALLNAQLLDDSAQELEVALTLDPASYLALSTLARIKVIQEDMASARALAHRLQKMQPDTPLALVILALAALKDGDTDEFVRLLSMVVERLPGVVVLRASLAQGLLQLGRYREAVHQLKIAARGDVASADIYQLLGTSYFLVGDMGRAERAFQSALTLAPDSPEVTRALARLLLQQDRYKDIITLLLPFLKTHKDDYEAHELLAAAHMNLGQYSAARTQLFGALSAVPKEGPQAAEHRARLSNNFGACYWHLKDLHKARQMFASAIEASPSESIFPYYNLGRLYLDLDQPREAEGVLRDALRHFPEDAEARYHLAQSLSRQERYDAAIDALQRIVGRGEATADTYRFLSGLLADCRGDVAGAQQLLEDAQHRFPDDAGILNNLAYVYLLGGDIDAAQRVLNHAFITSDADDQLVLPATQGLLYLMLGDTDRGREGYEAAAQDALQRGHTRMVSEIRQKMHLELARAYLRQENHVEARREIGLGLKERESGIYRQHLVTLAQKIG